ncbi:MAG TPA: 3-keto-5-aminohexanoate cleavage protein [Sporichthya sp.]|nr:3-keto-5-aminohexanoate cleavage protein [Sporichthya sp.]
MRPVPNDPFPLVRAPTGMVPTRADSPHVPLTPEELTRDVRAAASTGLTSVHIHARNSDGAPDWRREAYARFVGAVREVDPEILINVSTSGRDWSELERRADCLALDGDLKPDLASLTLSSLNFVRQASVNPPDVIRGLARLMTERGIVPELEVFDLGMANMVHVLRREGLIPRPAVVNLFLGNIAGAQATLSALGLMVADLPDDAIWSGAGLGDFQPAAHAMSLAAGGGVRVGLEDGLYVDARRETLATNPGLVERAHALGSLLGRRVMTAKEMRARLDAG